MKVSIITTCYNREKTIREAIESVLTQDYADIELIIVDGASSDGSVDIIKEYKDRVKFISEPDHGMYEALNKGLRMATGDVVGLVHSDDFLFDNHVVSHIVKRLNETNADFLYGNGLFVNAQNTNKVVRKWISGTYRLWKVRHGWLPLHPACYIKRSVIERLGYYNETFKIAGDTDFLFRYLVSGELYVTYLDEYIIKMRMGGLSTNAERRKQMWNEDLRVFRAHGLRPTVTKLEKIVWKIPQFIKAKFM